MKPSITLEEWDKLNFDPPHSIRTLREWAKNGRIYPKPELVGREYRVQPDAVYIPRRKLIERVTVLKSDDPVVNEIFNGTTRVKKAVSDAGKRRTSAKTK